MRSGDGRRLFQRVQEFLLRNGGGAALHHDDAAGVVRQLRSVFGGGAGGQGRGERGDHGVAGAGDIGHLVGAEDRECQPACDGA